MVLVDFGINVSVGHDQVRPARRRETHEAGAGLLGLHHRLGDAGRPRAVPPRHLSARRRGPGTGRLGRPAAAAGAAAGIGFEAASGGRHLRVRFERFQRVAAPFSTRRPRAAREGQGATKQIQANPNKTKQNGLD